MINKRTFDFLKTLEKNNTKEWFHANKDWHVESKAQVQEVMAAMQLGLNLNDVIEKSKLFRIHRDVRFSKDKTPYKTSFSGSFMRQGADRRGSYYFYLKPGETVIGGGFYGPEKADLFRIRKEFESDVSALEKIVSHKDFVTYFGELKGDGVATAPRDFDKNHPNIKWIRKKQFYAFRSFTDKEVMSESFLSEVDKTFQAIRPFFDYMTDVLTTDLNGESIL